MSREFDGGDYLQDAAGGWSAQLGAGRISGHEGTWLAICKLDDFGAESTFMSRWGPGAGQIGYLFCVNATTGYIQLACHNGFNVQALLAGTEQVPTGEWIWVAATMSATGPRQRTYLNGVLGQSAVQSVAIGSWGSGYGARLHVGGRESNGYMDGKVKLVACWERELTAAELLTAYNEGIYDLDLIMGIQTASIKGAWDLDDIATDLSGRGFPLTNTGSFSSDDDPPGYPVESAGSGCSLTLGLTS